MVVSLCRIPDSVVPEGMPHVEVRLIDSVDCDENPHRSESEPGLSGGVATVGDDTVASPLASDERAGQGEPSHPDDAPGRRPVIGS